jgi:UDPglucose 6-dehydrogenase
MRVAVVGTGYVGLVAGACFADAGNRVICVDKDARKVAALRNAEIPIYEPGLETLVRRGIDEGRLTFTTSTAEGVQGSDIIFLAVGTPPLPNGEPDLSYLKAAAQELGRAMNGYKVIVNKSTVPIGTHHTVAEWISEFSKHPFDVASNPEFMKEGSALEDFLKPDRVVIGSRVPNVVRILSDLYEPFVRQGNPILVMDPVSAEMTKYACNSFLATRISFMNELAVLAEKVGGDIEEIRKGMATDVRIGRHFLYAGVGYGGSCFPKDVQALVATGRAAGVPMRIVNAAEEANAAQKLYMVTKIKRRLGSNLSGKTIGVWGLAFKPNTDDMREAPSLTILPELIRAGAKVKVYDPVAQKNARSLLPDGIEYTESALDASSAVDALVLLTEWNEFRSLDFSELKNNMKSALVFDGRNIFDPGKMSAQGFEYHSIGRTPSGSRD